jgi:hypothetical protein
LNELINTSKFWDNLDKKLTKMRKLKDEYFIAAIFDRSLIFWLNKLAITKICEILFKHMS